ncbi:MAG: hypothetical protein HN509_07905 [Halobacteriovoraceae bacterium]|jgi:hypothetical protein|nr:hypothetical protein [Halobacteriovoraceae bacterium]MBT5094943.1 hypothetical protein [Halobacteriovoraceae bacterium]
MEGYFQADSNRTKLAEDLAYPFLVQEFEKLILGLPGDHVFENDDDEEENELAAG